ncbi:Fanconi-associated nuclease 1 [Alcanivorax sp. ALC70]|nr:Fanconi-associated nuclease 1 [Alcanivorax sp. ALC70]
MDSIAAPATLDDPLYYLRNFETVLRWVSHCHGDLLDDAERAFVAGVAAQPVAARALLTRMVMRKGELFRADKLRYPEIGPAMPALASLEAAGWVRRDGDLTLDDLFRLYTKAELGRALAPRLAAAGLDRHGRKADWLATLAEHPPAPRPLPAWDPEGHLPPAWRLTVMPVCERLRLMFFGNLYQSWSEFVLAELGTFRYERVRLDATTRPYRHRADLDAWLAVHACRERFEAGEPVEAVAADLPDGDTGNPWVEERRHKLRYKLARQWEREDQLERAEALYAQCRHPDARARRLRVLERRGEYRAALALASEAAAAPESEAERQQLGRLLPRLHRKLDLPRPVSTPPPATEQWSLTLPVSRLMRAGSVEGAVAEHFHREDAPVCYVENTLFTGLFGLLCWEAVFAPLPGAFFHPFQSGPADLHRPDFLARRRERFAAAFADLDSGRHRRRILDTFRRKYGTQSPFVHWGALSEPLLELALDCIPAAHLARHGERLLGDIKANRAGLPDLIQFFPARGEYRMIEVKGPGDRLQDNQRRWLAYFAEQGMPAVVCKVAWEAG